MCGYLIKSDELGVILADFCLLFGNNKWAAPATSPPSPARMDSAEFLQHTLCLKITGFGNREGEQGGAGQGVGGCPTSNKCSNPALEQDETPNNLSLFHICINLIHNAKLPASPSPVQRGCAL